ncbi:MULTISPECIES: hypothetical protein [unclassified Paenibacillus]|uniref:hypothetical protein n=1 Tax=unclassified Paenibacillus TaxID=185978 RepID=UPI001AEA9E8B|nr:hypothetical protein [Paenibacillus sp. PvP091]MBP1170788.1 hypothetical protein [Paenibacillus sp. PvR098]MBP2441816.1 hypothetical protein [Paenibacillus sp. PvP052]
MKKPNQFVYRNDRYGFTLRFPSWWRNYCVVGARKQDRDTEYELHFRFKYKGKLYEDIFTIMVYRMTREEWVKQGYIESPLAFIAEVEGRVFAYLTPGELPYTFYDSKAGDYDYKKYRAAIELLKRMVNQDVPRIVQSLRFPGRAITMTSTPYRVKKVCLCLTHKRVKRR